MSIGGAGIALPPPQTLYPARISGISYQAATNRFRLTAGASSLIPPGIWLVNGGLYGMIQILDPVSGLWIPHPGWSPQMPLTVNSDGVNYRVANLTGCPIGALLTNCGSGYTSAPTVTASTGSSLWTAILGGAVGTSGTGTVATAGTGMSYTPTVWVAAPPPGGVQATAVATLSGGGISAITFTDQGAGYTTAPAIVVTPDPLDPGTSITVPTATCTLASGHSDKITALICTNYGSPLTAAPTLTFSGGAGSGAAATAIMLLTIASITAAVTGAAYGTSQPFIVVSAGGTIVSGAGTFANPAIGAGQLLPRPCQIIGTSTSAGIITATGAVIVDGGLFQVAPTLGIVPAGATGTPSTIGQVTPVMGSGTTTITMQNLGGAG